MLYFYEKYVCVIFAYNLDHPYAMSHDERPTNM